MFGRSAQLDHFWTAEYVSACQSRGLRHHVKAETGTLHAAARSMIARVVMDQLKLVRLGRESEVQWKKRKDRGSSSPHFSIANNAGQ